MTHAIGLAILDRRESALATAGINRLVMNDNLKYLRLRIQSGQVFKVSLLTLDLSNWAKN